jgi:hypothetical protein
MIFSNIGISLEDILAGICTYIIKRKAVPRHPMKAHGGEEIQLLLIHDLGTRWDEWSASRTGRALPPGKGPAVPIGQEAGWAPEPVWTQRLEEKSFCFCRG